MDEPDEASKGYARHGKQVLRRLRSMDRLSILAVCLMLVGLAGFGWYVLAEQHQRSLVARENDRIVSTERLLSALKDVETGERGYVITGDEAYLAPYQAGSARIDTLLRALAGGGGLTDTLAKMVTERREQATRIISVRRDEGNEAARKAVIAGDDKAAMDRSRAAALVVVRTAQDAARQHEDADLWRGPILLTAATTLTVLGFGTIGFVALRRRRGEYASRAMLSGVLDNAPVGLGFLDTNLHVRHMNKAMVAMSVRGLGADVGASIWDSLPELRSGLEPRLRKVIESNRVVRDVEVSVEDAEHPKFVRTFVFSFFPLIPIEPSSPADRPRRSEGVGVVVLDVTARRRNERQVRESEERFRSLIEASSAIIWVTAASGQFHQPQKAWADFTGQNFASMEGMGWLDAVHPDDRADMLAQWEAALAGPHILRIEHRLRRADGTWRIMAGRAVPILEEDGSVREWIGAHSDITERRQAEAELLAAKDAAEHANRAKSQFLANMSHELRTPLSAVIGYSEMLEEEMEDLGHGALLEDLGKIKSNARHLLGLINDVLDLSKIEADRMTAYAEDFDPVALLREVAATVDALVVKKNNQLVLDLGGPGTLGQMHTDQVKLRQCLFNLISNAAKFTENGTITLRARRSAEMMSFSVTDSGIGMSAEQRERLFERFSQADDSTTRRFGGTGLGLAITRAFCRLLGGDVEVTSEVGTGSTFTMRIAATLREQEPSDEAEICDAVANVATGKHLVLVVDDDASQRDLLDRFLERQGFAVRTAADGPTGLALARSLQPRAILLDVMMPQMDGWSVLTALKADPLTTAIPVILVTFVNEPTLGASLGAADLIPKPVDWDRLKQVLEQFRGEGGVLLVDDDFEARRRLRLMLERSGWSVTEAVNGREALAAVDRLIPQIIVLDLNMPVMDGFAFLHSLRERPHCHDVPVVVLTARDLSAADRRKLASADRVLAKGDTSLSIIANEVMALTASEPDTVRAQAAGETT